MGKGHGWEARRVLGVVRTIRKKEVRRHSDRKGDKQKARLTEFSVYKIPSPPHFSLVKRGQSRILENKWNGK